MCLSLSIVGVKLEEIVVTWIGFVKPISTGRLKHDSPVTNHLTGETNKRGLGNGFATGNQSVQITLCRATNETHC